jgi:U4/U6.U5 tri-snRNP-associated protein 3
VATLTLSRTIPSIDIVLMSDYRRDSEDVESYRSRQRQNERQRREASPPPAAPKRKPEGDRESRMARLRREMKDEDTELADALDQKKKEADDSKHKPQETIIEVNQEELDGLEEEEQMKMLMGIQGFGSTKGEQVEDNKTSAARGVAAKNKARKYRQYMNRKNGFNRPLEKMN